MKCKNCDNKLIEGIRFCLKCGADVETSSVKHCSKCGTKLVKGIKYCLKCGADVSAIKKPVEKKTIIVQEKVNDKVIAKSRLDVRIFEIF